MMMSAPLSEPMGAKEALDTMISSAVGELSIEESIAAKEDVYGISQNKQQTHQNESHEEIQAMLQMLEVNVSSAKQGTAYEIAESMNVEYCTNRGFRLMFLRASKYNSKQAARQMINFFNMKLKLFGREKIAKDITLDDLNEDDKKCLGQGSAQAVSASNRQIFMCLPGLRKFAILENEMRAWYYIIMSLLQFKKVQLEGITIVNYAVGSMKDKTSGTGFVELTRLLLSLPVHIAAAHHCCDDVTQYLLLNAAIRLGSPSNLARLIVHQGSHMEVKYKLSAYGIPQSALPLSPISNEVVLDNHKAWIRTRQVMDAVQNAPQGFPSMSHQKPVMDTGNQVFGRLLPSRLMMPSPSSSPKKPSGSAITSGIQPRTEDVLFGQENKGHPGNMKMHQLMDHLQKQYEAADKQGKMKISLVVVFSMKGTGSRFLDFDDATNQWQIVPDTIARNKVAKAIRNRRRYKGKEEEALLRG